MGEMPLNRQIGAGKRTLNNTTWPEPMDEQKQKNKAININISMMP